MTFEVASAQRPHPLETVCGDATVVLESERWIKCVILDGVGHGPQAHWAASRLARASRLAADADPVRSLEALHREALGTVGAAGGVATVERTSGELSYAGLGNTALRVFGERSQRLVSRDGVLGASMHALLRQTVQLFQHDVVLLHTDGVSSDFEVSGLPELAYASASFLARAVLSRFSRGHDDAACIVLRVVP